MIQVCPQPWKITSEGTERLWKGHEIKKKGFFLSLSSLLYLLKTAEV